jgi:predicted PhzF superfamily epimerase YddE/YHI9
MTAPVVQRLASFCDGEAGGNPAGVVVGDALPPVEVMQRIAAEVGYSETAFAARAGEGWRVRYFAP